MNGERYTFPPGMEEDEHGFIVAEVKYDLVHTRPPLTLEEERQERITEEMGEWSDR